jgi:hypothetical protein
MTTGNRDDDANQIVTCKEGGRPHPRTRYCNHVDEQPAPETGGEWRVVYDPQTSHPENYHIREQGNGDCVAHASTQQHAAQIVADHNNSRKLIVALETIEHPNVDVSALRKIAREALKSIGRERDVLAAATGNRAKE